jgi:hypothetical protein
MAIMSNPGELALSTDPQYDQDVITFHELHELARISRQEYVQFEIRERGASWPPRDLVDGGLGNAAELSDGMRDGNEERIVEGLNDTLWSAYVVADAYGIASGSLADQYARAHAEIRGGASHDVTAVRAELTAAACTLPRYVAVVEGRRSLPDGEQRLAEGLGRLICNLVFVAPVVEQNYGITMDPEASFRQHMAGLTIRISLQSLYSRVRERELTREQALVIAQQLAADARRQQLGETNIQAMWNKAPSRVRDVDFEPFPLPALQV